MGTESETSTVIASDHSEVSTVVPDDNISEPLPSQESVDRRNPPQEATVIRREPTPHIPSEISILRITR